MGPELIAEVAHQALKAYGEVIGEKDASGWDGMSKELRESAAEGVKFVQANRKASPSSLHNAWIDQKVKLGWRFGPVKDRRKKVHPYLKPWEELPVLQQNKVKLFAGVVNSLS